MNQESLIDYEITMKQPLEIENGFADDEQPKKKWGLRSKKHMGQESSVALGVAAAGDDGGDWSVKSGSIRRYFLVSHWVVTVLIIILGAGTAAAFLGLGITSANNDQAESFQRSGADLVKKVQGALEDYSTAASWIHGRCRRRNFTRDEFREMYEYMVASGLEFQAAQFDPNITHDQREAAEAEAREYYATHYPYIDYKGFMGFNYANQTTPEPRIDAPFYFPIHYMEPIPGNEKAIDLDYHAPGSLQRQHTVMACMNTGKPAITDRLRLVQEKEAIAYGVVLMHPGVNLTTQPDIWPRDLASIVIRIPDLLKRSARNQRESSAAYLYDSSNISGPVFLGAIEIVYDEVNGTQLSQLPEEPMESIMQGGAYYLEDVQAANKNWTVVIVALPGTFEPAYLFPILGGCLIFLASVLLAFWIHSNSRRADKFNKMKAQSDQEKAALVLENARQATKAERELNDFIAHEVRNPVAAAMSACVFVKNAVHEKNPLATEEAVRCIREDVDIIENALHFVNDLLRNMLDMHRAANKQMQVHMVPTDILHDILEPVEAILYQRSGKVRVIIDCPKNIFATTDRLRLKQIILNLARNSSKFVDEGFIRLRGEVNDDSVKLSVEDSGPGIPEEKRERLFSKFQESLDSLSQGTGIGLFLCKNLIELLGGEITLDNTYDSGLPGRPGAKIVVDLRSPPINLKDLHDYDPSANDGDSGETGLTMTDDEDSIPHELPEKLSVLFVDDDAILRKLFTRTVKTVAPTWDLREASNGETAIRLLETDHVDLIFMDMYMASVQKQLLGTETVQVLRSMGVTSRICGLSANDKEKEFLEAGADAFTFKPFPCAPRALTAELHRILNTERIEIEPEIDNV